MTDDWPTRTAADANMSSSEGYPTTTRHAGTTLTDATVGPRGPASRSTPGSPRAWSTSTAAISKGKAPQNSKGKRDLRLDIRGKLNPDWVAVLLGFPAEWLSVSSVTPAARRSSKRSARSSAR
jgi:hypothetical protein